MTISLRLSDADTLLIKSFAEMNGLSVSELVRQSVLDRIEDELDLKAYETALAEYRAQPDTYTLDDMEKELGLL
ncbi:MAG: CopG family transcriptional regulator [Clostridia bacterium]|nr:CopG family transcriptional regulator [Clostridia bacterium]